LLRKKGNGHRYADLHGGVTDTLKQFILRRSAQNGFVRRAERGVDRFSVHRCNRFPLLLPD
jgi:hypothetical protein